MTNSDNKTSREKELKQFKMHLRAWMKEHKKTAKWLAEKIGKAEGSVKNWLYTPLNITERNQRTITAIMEKYSESSDQEEEAERKGVGFVLIPLDGSVNPTPDYNFWANAAGVPTRVFYIREADAVSSGKTRATDCVWEGHARAEGMLKVAEWTTGVLMKRAAVVLGEAFGGKENQGERDAEGTPSASGEEFSEGAKKKIMESLAQIKTDGKCEATAGFPAEYKPGYRSSDGARDLMIAETAAKDWREPEENAAVLFLPVLYEKWRGLYAEWAASLSGKDAFCWMVETLNDAAKKDCLVELRKFITIDD